MESDNKNGDLFLIRYIKQKPIIWNANHPDYHDREKRERVFRELSKRTNLDGFFLKRRWITLRERYVKDLRCQLLKNSTKSNYKYSQELNYLKKHVKLKIQTNVGSNQSEEREESFEFEITEEDLRLDDNDADLNSVLIEFDDEILFESQVTRQNRNNSEVTEMKREDNPSTDGKHIELLDKLDEAEISTTTKTSITIEEPKVLEVPKKVSTSNKPETSSVTIEEPVPVPPKPPTDPSVRNEDVIFGELIVSQLMKITDETKKRSIKRSILDLFF